MPKKQAVPKVPTKRQARPKVQEPEPVPEIENLELSSDETEPIPEPPKLQRELTRRNAKKSVVADEEPAEHDEEPAEEEEPEPAPRKRGVAKAKGKKEPSLWLTVLKENGFMCKGGEFKPTPKKGTDDYKKVRAIFDERKAALESK